MENGGQRSPPAALATPAWWSAQVPQGLLALCMEGNEDSVLASTDSACSDSLAGLADSPAIGVIAFDCIARFHNHTLVVLALS